MKEPIIRISVWSGPRNISTALMYSFAQHSQVKVVDEPLYGHYLSVYPSKEQHPGANIILETMETNGHKVIENMLQCEDKPILFFKNMTHHLVGLDRSFLKSMVNIILTRDPVEMLPSFAEVIPNPTMEDVGYRMHMEIIKEMQTQGIPFAVLDSKAMLMNPEEQLRKLCRFIGMDFEPAMLQWTPGSRAEDGCWAPYWYKSVHQSSGFNKYTPKSSPFPEHLVPLLKACQPYYDQMVRMAI